MKKSTMLRSAMRIGLFVFAVLGVASCTEQPASPTEGGSNVSMRTELDNSVVRPSGFSGQSGSTIDSLQVTQAGSRCKRFLSDCWRPALARRADQGRQRPGASGFPDAELGGFRATRLPGNSPVRRRKFSGRTPVAGNDSESAASPAGKPADRLAQRTSPARSGHRGVLCRPGRYWSRSGSRRMRDPLPLDPMQSNSRAIHRMRRCRMASATVCVRLRVPSLVSAFLK